MKKIIPGLILLFSSVGLHAQSLSNSNSYIAPSAISNTLLVGFVDVTNNTNNDLNVMCQRTYNNLAVNPLYPTVHDSGHLSNFCWDLCYPEWVDISGGPVTIPANTTNSGAFWSDLETHGVAGTSTVTYSFFVEGNPNDETSVTFIYNYSTGISTISNTKTGLSAASPNPADAFTTMTYSLKAESSAYRIEIVNVLGSKMAEYRLTGKSGVMTIPTDNLNSGIYFYVLKEHDKTISSQKLVVSHK